MLQEARCPAGSSTCSGSAHEARSRRSVLSSGAHDVKGSPDMLSGRTLDLLIDREEEIETMRMELLATQVLSSFRVLDFVLDSHSDSYSIASG